MLEHMESLLFSLRAIQSFTLRGVKIDVRMVILKLVVFAGENGFIEQGIHLSKCYFASLSKIPESFDEYINTSGSKRVATFKDIATLTT